MLMAVVSRYLMKSHDKSVLPVSYLLRLATFAAAHSANNLRTYSLTVVVDLYLFDDMTHDSNGTDVHLCFAAHVHLPFTSFTQCQILRNH